MDKERLQLRRAVQQLYDMVEDTRHLAETTARAQDVRRTTLMPGESMQVMGDDEQVVARIGGSNPSGGLIEYEPQTGPDPEQPEAPELDALPGSITVTASGRDVNGDPAQGNHKRVIVHTSNLPNLAEQEGTNQGEFPGPAGQYGVTTTPGIWYVALQWETRSGKVSELSEEVQIEVPRLVDSADIQAALDEAQERLNEARQEFEDGNEARKDEIRNLNEIVLPGLENALRQEMEALEERVGAVDLSELEAALDELNQERLPAIEDTLNDKADSSELGALDQTLRDAFAEADNEVRDTVEGLPKVLRGTSAPSEDAPDGSTWFQHDGSLAGDVIAQWARVDGEWVSTPINSEAIANLDVGKLTAGGAVISDAVIQDLTAENGAFDRLDAREGWIGGVALQDDAVTARTVNVQELFGNTAVINEIFARVVRARLLEAEEALIGGTLLEDDAITTRHIVAEAIKAAQLDVQEIFADEAVIDTIWSDVVRARLLTAEEAIIGGALLKDNTIDVQHLNVTEELTAAVAQFLEITADMITANSFEGVTFTGNTFQTSNDPQRGVKVRGPENDIVAYDADGKLIMRIGDHDLNLLSGRLYTNTPGESPGVILSEDKGDGYGASFQFAQDGVDSYENPGLYTYNFRDPGMGHPDNLYASIQMSGPRFGGVVTATEHGASMMSNNRAAGVERGNLDVDDIGVRIRHWNGTGIASRADVGDGYVTLYAAPRSTDGFSQVVMETEQGAHLGVTNAVYVQINGKMAFSVDGAGNTFAKKHLQSDGTFHVNGESSFRGRTDYNQDAYFHKWIRNPGRPTRTNGANVYMGGSGEYLWKNTSVRRAKVNIESVPDIADRLLDLEPRIWIDRSDIEMESEEVKALIVDTPEGPRVDEDKLRELMPDGRVPRRVPGLVAEEVVDAGLDAFAEYELNEDGDHEVLQSVQYDRIWILLIPLVRRHRDQLAEHEETIAELQSENEALQSRVDEMEARLAKLEALLNE